jgi:hypothetical protein
MVVVKMELQMIIMNNGYVEKGIYVKFEKCIFNDKICKHDWRSGNR